MTVRLSSRLLNLEVSLVKSLCKHIDSPRSLMVYMLLEAKQFDAIADLSIDPNHYLDHQSFSDDYLVTKILSKNPRIPVSVDAKVVAMKKFLDAEAMCSETNERLDGFIYDGITPSRDITSVVYLAQQYVSKILGPLTRNKISFAESKMRFGPGATTSLSGVVTQGKKYSRRTLDATPRVLPYRCFGFPHMWKDSADIINIRRSSELRVVPKKATCGRTINIEPDLNIFVQLGQGALIRHQLLLFGLDLNTQAINQELAKRASIDDSLCTMDISGASDSVSRSLVWLMLPYAWADFLHFSRTDFVNIDGCEREMAKWSCMGNGYTFELETLIFYSVLLGCCEYFGYGHDQVIAYGDDLIFPSEFNDLVQRTLEFLGFKVNPEKTFGKGSFRESCGVDCFLGHNVRPIFFRSDHHDFETICYIYANSISRWASRRYGGVARDSRCFPAWLRCLLAVKPSNRHRIPDGFGDVGFISNWDEARPIPLRGRYRGFGGYRFKYRRIAPVMKRISDEGSYLASLNGATSSFSRAIESLRGRFRSASTRLGYSLEWPDLGPWSHD